MDINRFTEKLQEAIRAAQLIFFSGGDQTQLVEILEGTPLLGAIRERFRDGATLAGTSAGGGSLDEAAAAMLAQVLLKRGFGVRGGTAPGEIIPEMCFSKEKTSAFLSRKTCDWCPHAGACPMTAKSCAPASCPPERQMLARFSSLGL